DSSASSLAVAYIAVNSASNAYQTAQRDQSTSQEFEFCQFCEQEAYWLDDFALYAVLKEQHEDKPWHEWPTAYKFREKQALETFRDEQGEAIKQAKWLQFVFDSQWKALKNYCNTIGIQLFGDLPFYVSYDSADVWANPRHRRQPSDQQFT
ncbi:hypothetical protein EON80_30030, partial [bacterium]